MKTEEKTIGGDRFTVTQFPAIEAQAILVQLSKLVGPSLAAVISGGSFSQVLDTELNLGLTSAVEKLTQRLEEGELERLTVRLLQSTRMNGEELRREVINLKFAGELDKLYAVIAFVLEVNYRPLVRSIGKLLKEFAEQKFPAGNSESAKD